MKKNQDILTTEELQQLKWLMGTLLTLLSLWSLSSLDIQGGIYLSLGFLSVTLAFFQPRLLTRIPQQVWRPLGFFILSVVCVDFILNLPEFMPPLLRLVILLLLYRTLAPRRQRDDLQILLLCFFCLVISGVLTVSLLFGLQILLFTPIALGVLFLNCILDRGSGAVKVRSSWSISYSLLQLVRRVLHVLDYRVLVLGGILFAFIVTVSALLFFLTPRLDLHQAIPYLQIRSEAKAGFSENVKLGEVSEIQSDNAVAMRVDVPSLEAIDGSPYWRILILDKYSNGYFRISDELKQRQWRSYVESRELMGRDLLYGHEIGRQSSHKWTFYLEGETSQFLPIPGLFHSMRFEGVQKMITVPGLHHVGLMTVQQKVFSYQIEDLRWTHRFPATEVEVDAFVRSPMDVASEGATYPLSTIELSISEQDRAFLTDLNAEIVGEEFPKNVVDYSQLLITHLWKNYRYSLKLDPNRGAGDEVVNWLKTARTGHCEYFSSAFILLARDAGYPARMVVGFSGGAWNVVEDYFVVRNDDAHAWVEIYDPDTKEWLRVDPTPGSGSSNPDAPLPDSQKFEVGWDAWVDSLRIQWYRRVVNFDLGDQVELAISAKDIIDDFFAVFSQRMSVLKDSISDLLQQRFKFGTLSYLIAAFLAAIIVWIVWYTRYTVVDIVYRLLNKPKALNLTRVEASRLLCQFAKYGLQGPIHGELQAIRFGPPLDRADVKRVFYRAHVALKNAKKSPDK